MSYVIWTALGMLLIVAVIVLSIVLLWIHCRGRFVFLDDVIRERAAIVEPWKRFARQGNSLFVWAIVFFLICAAIIAMMCLPFLASIVAAWRTGQFNWSILGALWILLAVAIPFAIVAAYTVLFLSHFVIPIMHRYGLGASEAWGRFVTLLRAHPGPFLLYGL